MFSPRTIIIVAWPNSKAVTGTNHLAAKALTGKTAPSSHNPTTITPRKSPAATVTNGTDLQRLCTQKADRAAIARSQAPESQALSTRISPHTIRQTASNCTIMRPTAKPKDLSIWRSNR